LQAPESRPGPGTSAELPGLSQEKLELILDLPLKVTVILGRTRRPIKEVLGLAPGSILELATLADEPVEVLVNGALVALGEVVVVNDNFGVRIVSIVSPRERIQNLRPGSGHLSVL
jgi:flagellar motor switch protein FliN/FliY